MTPESLLELRRQGQSPEDPVLLSLVGPVSYDWPVIVLHGAVEALEVRGFIGLDVRVLHAGIAPSRTLALVDRLLLGRPLNLELVNVADPLSDTLLVVWRYRIYDGSKHMPSWEDDWRPMIPALRSQEVSNATH